VANSELTPKGTKIVRNRSLSLAAVVALALLLVLAPWRATGMAAQMGQTPPLDQLSGDDFDKAFLSQMIMHHGMAVMMAQPAAAQSAHQEAKDLAQGMITDQTREIAQMRGWAKDWYGTDVPDPMAMMDRSMGQGQGTPGGDRPEMGSGMGMPGHGGRPMGQMGMMGDMGMMHGMSIMNDLWKLSPQRLEVAFMSLMIPHHQGAIDMAMLAPDRASHQEVKDLAESIIRSQGDEITTMNGWLSSRYGL